MHVITILTYIITEFINRDWISENQSAFMHSEREYSLHWFPLNASLHQHSRLDRQTSLLQRAVISPATTACSIPSIRPRLQTEGHKRRGGERGFLETRTKSDTKTRGRVARGGWSQTSNTKPPLPQGTNKWLDRDIRRGKRDILLQFCDQI